VIATSDERNSDEKVSDLDALGFLGNDERVLAETKLRERPLLENDRRDVEDVATIRVRS
jgi:hypothetical protein